MMTLQEAKARPVDLTIGDLEIRLAESEAEIAAAQALFPPRHPFSVRPVGSPRIRPKPKLFGWGCAAARCGTQRISAAIAAVIIANRMCMVREVIEWAGEGSRGL